MCSWAFKTRYIYFLKRNLRCSFKILNYLILFLPLRFIPSVPNQSNGGISIQDTKFPIGGLTAVIHSVKNEWKPINNWSHVLTQIKKNLMYLIKLSLSTVYVIYCSVKNSNCLSLNKNNFGWMQKPQNLCTNDLLLTMKKYLRKYEKLCNFVIFCSIALYAVQFLIHQIYLFIIFYIMWWCYFNNTNRSGC